MRVARARRGHEPFGVSQRAGNELQAEEARAIDRARQGEALRRRRGEAEARVIGRVADQQDRLMAALGGARDRLAHQARADAEAAMGSSDRERAEHQRVDAAGAHRPEPHRADERVAVLGDEREAVGGQASGAQALARLLEARRAEGGLEQRLARGRVLGRARRGSRNPRRRGTAASSAAKSNGKVIGPSKGKRKTTLAPCGATRRRPDGTRGGGLASGETTRQIT